MAHSRLRLKASNRVFTLVLTGCILKPGCGVSRDLALLLILSGAGFRQVSQTRFTSLEHPHLVRMQGKSTGKVTVYLGSLWS